MALEIAEQFARARKDGSCLPEFPRVTSQAQAFEVQKCFLENPMLHGLGPKTGWKCGPVQEKTFSAMGLECPGRAPIFTANRFSTGAIVPLGPENTPGRFTVIEAEFGFLLKDSLPRRMEPYTEEEIWAAVDGMVPCFELCGFRVDSGALGRMTGVQMVSDFASNWGAVVGGKVEKSRLPSALGPHVNGEDTKMIKVELIRNGTVVAQGSAADNVGIGPNGPGPFRSLVWLANHLASTPHGSTLEAGDVVLPGAGALTREFAQGDHFMARFDVLGTVEMTLGPGDKTAPAAGASSL